MGCWGWRRLTRITHQELKKFRLNFVCANLDLWLLSAGNWGSMQNPQHSPWAHTHTGPHFQERLLCGGVKKTSCFFPKHKTLIRLVWFAGFVRIAVLFVVKLHSRCLLDSFNGNGYVFEGVQLSLLSTALRNDTIWRENADICRKKKTLNWPPFRKQNRQFARAGYSCTTPVLTIDTSQT